MVSFLACFFVVTFLEPEQITDDLWATYNRIWCTSRLPVLLEYAKLNVDLRWAPDLRHGSLFHQVWNSKMIIIISFQDWFGTVTIKDVVGRNLLVKGRG